MTSSPAADPTAPDRTRPRTVRAQVRVPVPVDQVAAWVQDPRHLPAWTGFFHEVGAAGVDGRHPARTAAGDITSWIVRDRVGTEEHLAICSEIRGRVERARLELAPVAGGTLVTFAVTVLHDATDARAEQQRSRMTAELDALCVELDHAAARNN